MTKLHLHCFVDFWGDVVSSFAKSYAQKLRGVQNYAKKLPAKPTWRPAGPLPCTYVGHNHPGGQNPVRAPEARGGGDTGWSPHTVQCLHHRVNNPTSMSRNKKKIRSEKQQGGGGVGARTRHAVWCTTTRAEGSGQRGPIAYCTYRSTRLRPMPAAFGTILRVNWGDRWQYKNGRGHYAQGGALRSEVTDLAGQKSRYVLWVFVPTIHSGSQVKKNAVERRYGGGSGCCLG